MHKRLIRRPIVENQTGLKRSQIYQLMAEGKFPRPVKLGRRAVAWDQDLIQIWIEERILLGSATGEVCSSSLEARKK